MNECRRVAVDALNRVVLTLAPPPPRCRVAVDALNRVVLTAGLDGTLRWWGFASHALSIGHEPGARPHRSDAIKQAPPLLPPLPLPPSEPPLHALVSFYFKDSRLAPVTELPPL